MHPLLRNVLCCSVFVVSAGHLCGKDEPKQTQAVIVPEQMISLINGKDLSAWYSWLTDDRYEDPRGVFKVQPDGTLRISGDGFGGLITHREYANYHLYMEYRWGTATWRNRSDKAKDGGVLLHCQGPEGNYASSPGKPGPWMNSVECQIIEGGVGDILVLPGKDADGKVLDAHVTCEIERDRDNEPVWKAGGQVTRFTSGRVNWFGRDPDWKDELGYRGPKDVDSPGQEWTKLEIFAKGDTLVYLVNGEVVNRAAQVFPNQGKLLLQTEGAEMFVRKMELRPLPEKLP